MTLHLPRRPSHKGATVSPLSIGGVFFCWVCEDVIREKKIPGKTAIPPGEYRITLTPSARFKRVLPLLHDVPNFSGVRIHPGNTAEDTEGCLLPGFLRYENSVGQSRAAFEALLTRMETATQAGAAITILIENPAA